MRDETDRIDSVMRPELANEYDVPESPLTLGPAPALASGTAAAESYRLRSPGTGNKLGPVRIHQPRKPSVYPRNATAPQKFTAKPTSNAALTGIDLSDQPPTANNRSR